MKGPRPRRSPCHSTPENRTRVCVTFATRTDRHVAGRLLRGLGDRLRSRADDRRPSRSASRGHAVRGEPHVPVIVLVEPRRREPAGRHRDRHHPRRRPAPDRLHRRRDRHRGEYRRETVTFTVTMSEPAGGTFNYFYSTSFTGPYAISAALPQGDFLPREGYIQFAPGRDAPSNSRSPSTGTRYTEGDETFVGHDRADAGRARSWSTGPGSRRSWTTTRPPGP